jgi:hypothetical protein
MDRLREPLELARIERIRDVLRAPIDRGKSPLSGTADLLARLHRRLTEIGGNPVSPRLR